MRMVMLLMVFLMTACGGRSLVESPFDVKVGNNQRQVHVALAPAASSAYQPMLSGQIVQARLLNVSRQTYFESREDIDGVEVVRLMSSCDSIPPVDSSVGNCRQVVRTTYNPGEVAATAITDDVGQVQLALDNRHYRLQLKSVPTAEDNRCYWGGAVDIGSIDSKVTMPVLVYCE